MAENIRKKSLKGGGWILTAYGLSQLIRLAGNLVLTRLLVPELFGLMTLANVFITGLNLFSDIGIGHNIIRSNRGTDPVFLNTAWTLQVTRGIALWLITLVIAWPVAIVYEAPILSQIIPVVGLGCIISGFMSTSVYSLNKDLNIKKIVKLELLTQIVGLLLTVILAFFYKNIWSLILGGMAGNLLKTTLSHFINTPVRNRILFDKASAKDLFSYGKWIFISTAMMFLATQSDKLLLGKFFTASLLGIYSVAIIFAEIPKQIVSQLSSKVIFPLISKFSHLSRIELRAKILRHRKFILLPLAALVAFLVSFGDVVIIILYDARYQDASWMLPLLAIGMWPLLLSLTIDPCLYVVSKPKFPALGNLLKFLWMITILPFSYIIAGNIGAVTAVAFNDIPMYLAVNYGLMRGGLSGLKQDATMTATLLIMIGLCLIFRVLTDMGLPGQAAFPGWK